MRSFFSVGLFILLSITVAALGLNLVVALIHKFGLL